MRVLVFERPGLFEDLTKTKNEFQKGGTENVNKLDIQNVVNREKKLCKRCKKSEW